MNLKKRLAARKSLKNKRAWDRLHGKGAVSVPPRRRRSRSIGGWGSSGTSNDPFGDWMLWDALSDFFTGIIEAIFKLFD